MPPKYENLKFKTLLSLQFTACLLLARRLLNQFLDYGTDKQNLLQTR